MPFQGVLPAGDVTGAALQTPLIIHGHLPLFIEIVKIRRTDMQAISNCTAALTDLLVNQDMGFLAVNLKNIQA
jgi:hypothetical protein